MPFPTHTYKCVGAQDHESLVWSHVVGWPALLPCARRSWMFPLPSTPPCATAPHCLPLRCKGPYGSVNSKCGPVIHRRAVRGSERLEVVLERIQPVLLWASLAWIFPPTSFLSISRFGRRSAGCLVMAPANRSRRCRRMVASTLWRPVFLRG